MSLSGLVEAYLKLVTASSSKSLEDDFEPTNTVKLLSGSVRDPGDISDYGDLVAEDFLKKYFSNNRS